MGKGGASGPLRDVVQGGRESAVARPGRLFDGDYPCEINHPSGMSRVIMRRLTIPSSADPVKDRSSLQPYESFPDHPHPALSQHRRDDVFDASERS
jgi:hypothetical protein